MKRTLVVLAAGLLALASCKKEGEAFFQGKYGYTSSGTLLCEYVDTTGGKKDTLQKSFTIASEQGMMHIELKDAEYMVLTTKDNGTNTVMVFDALISGTRISLKPVSRKILITVTDVVNSVDIDRDEKIGDFIDDTVDDATRSNVEKSIDVEVSGKGYKTNGLIVMTMDYAGGDFTVETVKDTTTYKIIGSNVNLVATAQ